MSARSRGVTSLLARCLARALVGVDLAQPPDRSQQQADEDGAEDGDHDATRLRSPGTKMIEPGRRFVARSPAARATSARENSAIVSWLASSTANSPLLRSGR